MFHIFLAFWWSRTPIFHFLYFSGYAPSRTSLIVASAHSYSPKTYPDILFLTFLGVRASSHFTYYGFSTLLFTENVPRHFIFYISLGTLLNCLTYFPPPLCTKGYRVALASTRYPSTNSLTFYIHISIYLYSSLLPAFSPLLWHTATFRFNEYLPHLCCHFYICTYS